MLKKIFFLIILVSLGFLIFNSSLLTKINQLRFKERILNINSDGSIVMNSLTSFNWDSVYTFAPNTTKNLIEEIIGFESKELPENIDENMTNLVFTYNNEIVCSVFEYTNNLGFEFYFDDFQGHFSRLSSIDNPAFNVKKTNDIIKLKYAKH